MRREYGLVKNYASQATICIKELLWLAADASDGLDVKIHVQIKALLLV